MSLEKPRLLPKFSGYMAQKGNTAVLLYRRSRNVTFLTKLSYNQNRFKLEVGSRFFGRIYPDRCDISSNGRYFLYFAMGQGNMERYKEAHYCWTAICTPPSITAHFLVGHNDTWGGGGSFVDDRTILIDPGMYPKFDPAVHKQFGSYKIVFQPDDTPKGKSEHRTSHHWQLIKHKIDPHYGDKYPIPVLWRKNNRRMILFRHHNDGWSNGPDKELRGSYSLYTYSLQHQGTGEEIIFNDNKPYCSWADFDNFGRLILAKGSRILIYRSFFDVQADKAFQSFELEDHIQPAA